MSTVTHLNDQEELVYNSLLRRIDEDANSLKVNPNNIVPLVANTVSLTDKFIVAPGEEKKKIVGNVVGFLFENVQVNDKQVVVQFLTTQLSSLIDTLVSVANGEYKMNYDFYHLFHNIKCNCTCPPR
jgi:hypothetical protein